MTFKFKYHSCNCWPFNISSPYQRLLSSLLLNYLAAISTNFSLSSPSLFAHLSSYKIFMTFRILMSAPTPFEINRRAPLHEGRISSLERVSQETDARIRQNEEVLHGMRILHTLQHAPTRSPTSLLRHFHHIQNENFQNARAAQDAIPALPLTVLPTVPAPTGLSKIRVMECMRVYSAKLQVRYRGIYSRRAVDRVMWKARLFPSRSKSRHNPRKVSVSQNKEFNSIFRKAERDIRTGDISLEKVGLSAHTWEKKVSTTPHERKNAAHVPEWDHQVAAQQPRIPAGSILVHDARKAWYNSCVVNPWTTNERLCFLRHFIFYGKNFDLIAKGLFFKSGYDVARFYYRYKHTFGLKRLADRVSEHSDSVLDSELRSIARIPDLALHIEENKSLATELPFSVSTQTSSSDEDDESRWRHGSPNFKNSAWKGIGTNSQERNQPSYCTQGYDLTVSTCAVCTGKVVYQQTEDKKSDFWWWCSTNYSLNKRNCAAFSPNWWENVPKCNSYTRFYFSTNDHSVCFCEWKIRLMRSFFLPRLCRLTLGSEPVAIPKFNSISQINVCVVHS